MKKTGLFFGLLIIIVVGLFMYHIDNRSHKRKQELKSGITFGRIKDGSVVFVLGKEFIGENYEPKLKSFVKKNKLTPSDQPFFLDSNDPVINKFTKAIKKFPNRINIHFSGGEPISTKIDKLSVYKWECGSDYYGLKGEASIPKNKQGTKLKIGGFGGIWDGEYVVITDFEQDSPSDILDINNNGKSERITGNHKGEILKIQLKEEGEVLREVSFGC